MHEFFCRCNFIRMTCIWILQDSCLPRKPSRKRLSTAAIIIIHIERCNVCFALVISRQWFAHVEYENSFIQEDVHWMLWVPHNPFSVSPSSFYLWHETHTESIYCSFRSVYTLRSYDVLSIFDFRRRKKINKTTAGPAIVAIRMYFHTSQNGWRALNYESDARNERLKIYHPITLADCHTNSEHPKNGKDFWLLHGSHSQLMKTE